MFIHNLKCKFYYLIKKKDKIVGYKLDTLTKHVSHRIIVFVLPMLNMIVKIGGEYIAKNCAHLKIQGCMPRGGSQVNFGQNKQTCR